MSVTAAPISSNYHVADISLADWGHKEIRIAETEKYPHVTYFFSGGILQCSHPFIYLFLFSSTMILTSFLFLYVLVAN